MKLFVLSLILISAFARRDLSSQTYQQQSANSKLQQVWGEVTKDSTSGSFPSQVGIFTEDMKTSFDHTGDQFPEGRIKYIHSVGNVGQVEFVATEAGKSTYSGVFKGAKNALLRFSCAKKPDETKINAKDAYDNFTPGFGLKFFRDQVPSANAIAMYGVNGVPTWNFFTHPFSNHIGGAKGIALSALGQKFSSATDFIQTLGLKDLAEFDEAGKPETDVKFPWRLVFRAPKEFQSTFSEDFELTYTEQLKTIPIGTTIYEVYAVEDPSEACEVLIGTLVSKSQFVTSKFGDEELFFRHNFMEIDHKVKPSWYDYTPKWTFMNLWPKKPKAEGACPFSSLWQ